MHHDALLERPHARVTVGPLAEVAVPAGELRRRHVPALDGIRGLAVLMVMVLHLFDFVDTPWTFAAAVVSSGFIGVDLFFVLSGFLITGILCDARGKPGYFRNFYARRALRIFPLYYAFLAVFAMALLVPGARLIAGGAPPGVSLYQTVWAAFYGTNILIALQGHFINFFLNPFWSLAVEEHFYMVWPLLTRFVSFRAMRWVCGAMIAGALACRLYVGTFGGGLVAAYVLTPCRVDGLALGALLALLQRGRAGLVPLVPWARAGFWGLLAVLVAALCVWGGLDWGDRATAAPLFTVVSLFMGCLLVLTVEGGDRSGFRRFFSLGWLRMLGRYSYALYVFNEPVAVIVVRLVDSRMGRSPASVLISGTLGFAVTLGLALASWHLLEKRCLSLKRRFE